MALTRKLLKGMGLTDEQVDTIIEAHTDTVDGLKSDLKAAQESAKSVPDLEKKVKGLEEDLKTAKENGWKDKYDTLKKEFEDHKKGIEAEKAAAAKEKAVRAFYESKNITGDNLELAMRGSKDEIAAIEMDGDKIKDTKSLDDLVSGTFSRLVSTTRTEGAHTSNPPANGGGKLSRAEIYKKDDKGRYVMDASARQSALAQLMSEKE